MSLGTDELVKKGSMPEFSSHLSCLIQILVKRHKDLFFLREII